jgi:hypothetical protein
LRKLEAIQKQLNALQDTNNELVEEKEGRYEEDLRGKISSDKAKLSKSKKTPSKKPTAPKRTVITKKAQSKPADGSKKGTSMDIDSDSSSSDSHASEKKAPSKKPVAPKRTVLTKKAQSKPDAAAAAAAQSKPAAGSKKGKSMDIDSESNSSSDSHASEKKAPSKKPVAPKRTVLTKKAQSKPAAAGSKNGPKPTAFAGSKNGLVRDSGSSSSSSDDGDSYKKRSFDEIFPNAKGLWMDDEDEDEAQGNANGFCEEEENRVPNCNTIGCKVDHSFLLEESNREWWRLNQAMQCFSCKDVLGNRIHYYCSNVACTFKKCESCYKAGCMENSMKRQRKGNNRYAIEP